MSPPLASRSRGCICLNYINLSTGPNFPHSSWETGENFVPTFPTNCSPVSDGLGRKVRPDRKFKLHRSFVFADCGLESNGHVYGNPSGNEEINSYREELYTGDTSVYGACGEMLESNQDGRDGTARDSARNTEPRVFKISRSLSLKEALEGLKELCGCMTRSKNNKSCPGVKPKEAPGLFRSFKNPRGRVSRDGGSIRTADECVERRSDTGDLGESTDGLVCSNTPCGVARDEVKGEVRSLKRREARAGRKEKDAEGKSVPQQKDTITTSRVSAVPPTWPKNFVVLFSEEQCVYLKLNTLSNQLLKGLRSWTKPIETKLTLRHLAILCLHVVPLPTSPRPSCVCWHKTTVIRGGGWTLSTTTRNQYCLSTFCPRL